MEKKIQRVTFYVDGYNFYYGIRKAIQKVDTWTNRYYWLDMVKFFESFLGDNQRLEKVIYFTATPLGEQKASRQSTFLSANKFLNGNRFEVVRGYFLDKYFECPNCHYCIPKPEEKKTDVNISVRMIGDCVLDRTDIVSLVSADSDLVPPLEFIKEYYPQKSIKVYFPPFHNCNNLRDNLKNYHRRPVLLEHNQRRFDDAVMAGKVGKYTVPEKWVS